MDLSSSVAFPFFRLSLPSGTASICSAPCVSRSAGSAIVRVEYSPVAPNEMRKLAGGYVVVPTAFFIVMDVERVEGIVREVFCELVF